MENTPETTAVDGGLPRRTVLAGAAWTIPVIAAATVAPTASASGTVALAFNKSGYTGDVCSTITGIAVVAKNSGAPQAGVPLSVTLSGGYTFTDGSTSKTGISDTNGSYSLPGVIVPASGSTGSATAIGGGGSASAALSATSRSFGYFDNSNTYHAYNAAVPANSTLVPGGWILTPNGDLIDPNRNGLVVRTGVASMGDDAMGFRGIVNKDGTYGYFNSSNEYRTYNATVPANSTFVPGAWILTPSGDLIDPVAGVVRRTGVASMGGNSQGFRGIINTDGTFGYFDNSNTYHAYNAAVPANSTLVPGGWILTPNGDLIDPNRNGLVVRTGVASMGDDAMGFRGIVNKDGTYGYFNSSNEYRTYNATVPANSTFVPGAWILTPSGDLIDPVAGVVRRTGVASMGGNSQGFRGIINKSTC
ncbi:hypothetical protein [Microbacterium sp. NPDC086615]|uniref:hypothetical protein n=1 Tax=Microbacterium sp. NPDC086615 TaxID=3154865 RepID=UPI00343A980B